MPSATTTKRALSRAGITTVGIDVGGERKGFHAVAITGGDYANHLATKNVQQLFRFSGRRRSAIEAQAEQDLMRELEDTAKKLPKNLDR